LRTTTLQKCAVVPSATLTTAQSVPVLVFQAHISYLRAHISAHISYFRLISPSLGSKSATLTTAQSVPVGHNRHHSSLPSHNSCHASTWFRGGLVCRTATLQKCAVVPRRAGISGSYFLISLNSRGEERHVHYRAVRPYFVELLIEGHQFKNNHFTEMCSGSEAGSYRTLTTTQSVPVPGLGMSHTNLRLVLYTSLKLVGQIYRHISYVRGFQKEEGEQGGGGTRIYEPEIRARLGD